MFITYLDDQIEGRSEAGLHHHINAWKRFDTTQIHFQLVERRRVAGELEEVLVFISDPYELRRLVMKLRAVDSAAVRSVKVCTPGPFNGTDGWSQDLLLVLYLAVHKLTSEVKLIYTTEKEVFGLADAENLKAFYKEVLYQASGHAIDLFDDYISVL